MYVQLYQIKKHLNIDDSFHEDDEYLVDLEQVAERAIEKHIDDKLDEIVKASGGLDLPAPLVHAILLLIGNLYSNREPVTFSSSVQVPYTLNYLTDLYKNYGLKYTGGENKIK